MRIIYAFAFLVIGSAASATNLEIRVDQIHEYETHDPISRCITQESLDHYVLGLTAGEHPPLTCLGNVAAVGQALKTVLAATDVADTAATRRRRSWILELASRWAKELSDQDKEKVRDEVKGMADRLLNTLEGKPFMLEPLTQIFDNLHLWSESNWWFFAKSLKNRETFLKENRSRIRNLLPQISNEQRLALVKNLREIRPRDEVSLSLLSELTEPTGEEWLAYFKLVAKRFEQRSDDFVWSSRLREAYGKNDEFLRPAVQKSFDKIKGGDPVIRIAFEKAKHYFGRKDRQTESRFFVLFEEALKDGNLSGVLLPKSCRELLKQ